MSRLPDPFSVLGLPPSFEIDAAAIESAYLQRAATSHPDLAGAGDAEEADAISAELNDARQVLLDPEQRANALLTLRGGPSKEADKALPENFLLQMMETREQIEDALATHDADRVLEWKKWALDERASYVARVGGLFRDQSPSALNEIRRMLNAWRYIERLNEQLNANETHRTQ